MYSLKISKAIILDNSRFVRWLINQCKTCRQKIINYLTTSAVIASTQEIKKELYCLPIKTVSIIVVIAILTNIFFSIILSEEIGLLGWIIRVLFLFIGLGGLFCNADWKTIEDGSFVLRYINNACKIRDQI